MSRLTYYEPRPGYSIRLNWSVDVVQSGLKGLRLYSTLICSHGLTWTYTFLDIIGFLYFGEPAGWVKVYLGNIKTIIALSIVLYIFLSMLFVTPFIILYFCNFT